MNLLLSIINPILYVMYAIIFIIGGIRLLDWFLIYVILPAINQNLERRE